MKTILPVDGIMNCLGQAMLKMIENDQFFNNPATCKTPPVFNKPEGSRSSRFQEAYYLRNLKENLEFYRTQLNSLSKSNINDKLICDHIEEVVQTYEKLKVHILDILLFNKMRLPISSVHILCLYITKLLTNRYVV